MNIDCLFINPGDHKKNYQELSRKFTAIAPPVWALLIAEYLRNKGHTVAIYDSNISGWSVDIAKDLFNKYNPQIVVLLVYGHNPSASTQTMPIAGKIAKDIKAYNKDIPIVMGGTHPSALPQRTLREEAVDFVVQGVGASTIDQLISYIEGKINLQDIKGLWYRKDKSIYFTSPPDSLEDLDRDFPGYAWDLIPNLNSYRAHNMHCFQYFSTSKRDDFIDVRSPYAVIYTSLGCPYSCHYCCINAVYGKPGIKYWSVQKVISWIDLLVNKYNVKNIRFDDELFILSPKRVELLCDLLIERGYDLNIWAYARVDTIKEPLLKKLKQAGIRWLCLGIESANERVRTSVNKTIKADIKSIVKLLQLNEIYVHGNYMFGLPEDDYSSMTETLNFAMELNCEFANFYTFMAYPGSKLYDLIYGNNNGPANWASFSQLGYETTPLPTNYLSANEVLRFRDQAFYSYFSNPKYLSMIRNKFGECVERHIEEMLSIKIERKILSEEKEDLPSAVFNQATS